MRQQKSTSRVSRRLRPLVPLIAPIVGCGLLFFANQVDGQTTWNGGNGIWNSGVNWDSSLVPSGDVFVDGDAGVDSTIILSSSQTANVERLTIDAGDTVSALNNSNFRITSLGTPATGKIINNGLFTLTNAGNLTDLEINSNNVELSGTGVLTLGGSNANSRIVDVNGGDDAHFSNSSTINGFGQIGVNSLQLTNQSGGLIDSNVSGNTLTVNANALGLTNQGTMRASSGGNLLLTGSAITNAGGTIEAQAGSTVSLSSGTAIVGGSVQSTGTGSIRLLASQTATMEDVSISGKFEQLNNSNLFLNGTIDNQSTEFSVTNAGNLTDVEIADGTTLQGGGKITLGGSSNNSRVQSTSGEGILTNVDNTIEGRGQIGVNTLQVINEAGGLIDANDSTGSLTLNPRSGDSMVNQGTMQASAGGTLVLVDGQFDNVGGVIEAKDASKVVLNNGTSITGGEVKSSDTGVVEVGTSQTVTLADTTIDGSILQKNNSNVFLDGTINNLSQDYSVENAANLTDVEIADATTLQGGGKITLEGSANTSRVLSTSGVGVLTNVDNTIEGRGQIGANSLQVINEAGGLIDANDSTGTLTLDPRTGNSMVNQGTMQASSGGTLALMDGQFDNAGGVIEAKDASKIILYNGTSITGGEVKSSDTGIVEVDSSQTVTLTDTTIDGSVLQKNNSNVLLDGTINNLSQDFLVDNIGNNTDVIVGGVTTLQGGGKITLGGVSATGRILDDAGDDGVLTNVDNTIEGKGQIGGNTMGVVNQAAGIIDGNDTSGVLTVDVSSAGLTNDGLMKASDGGQLALLGAVGTFNNNGMIRAEADSTVRLSSGATVVGGDLESLGTGRFLLTSSDTARLEDLDFSGLFDAENNSNLELMGTINNQGSLVFTNAGNSTDFRVESSTSLTGGGTITLGGVSSTSRILDELGTADGVLTNVDNTIQGKGQIGVDRLNVINQSVIDANDSTGTLTLDPRSAGDQFTNTGTIRASNGATLVMSGAGGGDFLNSSGTIEALEASTVQLASGANVVGGTLQTTGSGKFLLGSSATASITDLITTGTIEASNNSNLELIGNIENQGQMSFTNASNSTDLRVESNASLTGGGVIALGGSAGTTRVLDELGTADGVLTNVDNTIQGQGQVGAGRLQFINAAGGILNANISGDDLVLDSRDGNTNQGLFVASGGGILNITGDMLNEGIIQAEMASLVDSSGVLTNTADGSLIGNGEIEAAAIFNDGRIAPGASVGALTLDGNTAFGASSLLDMEIDGSGADLLTVTGILSLDGNLQLDLLGFVPMASDEYTIAVADGPITGSFDNVLNGNSLLTVGGEGSFEVHYGSSSIFGADSIVLSSFTLTSVPEPGSMTILLALATSTLLVRRRRAECRA